MTADLVAKEVVATRLLYRLKAHYASEIINFSFVERANKCFIRLSKQSNYVCYRTNLDKWNSCYWLMFLCECVFL
jgi:hypothetical protein